MAEKCDDDDFRYISQISFRTNLLTFFLLLVKMDLDIGGIVKDIPITCRNSDLWLAAACIMFNPLFWNAVSIKLRF